MGRMFSLLMLFLPIAVTAEELDGKFADYAEYSAYVDEAVKSRDIVGFVLRMGGRDEFTPEQLESTKGQFLNLYQSDFTNVTVFRKKDLGGGLAQEARAYWVDDSYVFIQTLLHQREGELIVLTFRFHSDVNAIMDKF